MAVSLEPGSCERTSLKMCSALSGSDLASFCASAIRELVSGTAMVVQWIRGVFLAWVVVVCTIDEVEWG